MNAPERKPCSCRGSGRCPFAQWLPCVCPAGQVERLAFEERVSATAEIIAGHLAREISLAPDVVVRRARDVAFELHSSRLAAVFGLRERGASGG